MSIPDALNSASVTNAKSSFVNNPSWSLSKLVIAQF
nr:MAG TPA: hypothetical protein [Caudoviricetes sp.]